MIGKRDHHHRSEHVTITLEQLIPQDHLVHKLDAVIESFHSNLKSEEFQYFKFNSLRDHDASERVVNYLNCYIEERIQEKLG